MHNWYLKRQENVCIYWRVFSGNQCLIHVHSSSKFLFTFFSKDNVSYQKINAVNFCKRIYRIFIQIIARVTWTTLNIEETWRKEMHCEEINTSLNMMGDWAEDTMLLLCVCVCACQITYIYAQRVQTKTSPITIKRGELPGIMGVPVLSH
mgnify:CR=1 FL=1